MDGSSCTNTITTCANAATPAQCVGLGCTNNPATCTGTHTQCDAQNSPECTLHDCNTTFTCVGNHAACGSLMLGNCNTHPGCSRVTMCLGGSHPGCNTWNYVGGMDACLSHQCTWNGDNATPRCSGTPHTCLDSNCDYAGCNTQDACTGTPDHGCPEEDIFSCGQDAACFGYQSCDGFAHSCQAHANNPTECTGAGCTPTASSCTGMVRSCATFPQGTCAQQAGCTWTLAGQCAAPASCNAPNGATCDPGCLLDCQ